MAVNGDLTCNTNDTNGTIVNSLIHTKHTALLNTTIHPLQYFFNVR